MIGRVVPVCALRHDQGAAFPLEVVAAFSDCDVMEDDVFTFTVSVQAREEADRETLCQVLIDKLALDEAARMIELLAASDWKITFLVDAY